MQALRDRNTVVPDYFRYTHSETGHTTIARDYTGWIDDAKRHRRANSLSIPDDFEAQMNDQLCAQLPPEFCEGSDPNRPWVDTRFTIGDVADAMLVFVSFAMGGFQFMSQEEANRRARICVGCYNNVNIPGCGACRQMAEFVTGSLAQRSTPHDAALKVCGVCRCVGRAQVHVPLEALAVKNTADRQTLYPSFCWQKIGGENYRDATPVT